MADEIVRLRSQLAAALLVNSAALDKAERERDEARRERDEAQGHYTVLSQRYASDTATLRHRAERAERVVEAARAYEQWQGKWYDYTVASGEKPAKQQRAIIESVRALNAAEGAR